MVAKAVIITTSVAGESSFTRRSTSSPESAPSRRSRDDEVEAALGDARERALRVGGGLDPVTLLAEQDLQELAHGRLVVDHQDRGHRHLAFPRGS